MLSESTTPKGPWYNNYDYWKNLSLKYIKALRKMPKEATHHSEINTFSQYMGMKLIYESNLIEDEGLSDMETRQLIKENFPEIPNNYNLFKEFPTLSGGKSLDFPLADWYEKISEGLKNREKN